MTDLTQAARYATAVSSLLFRFGTWVFLRWIPAHGWPPIAAALFAIYIPSFIYSLLKSSPYNIISDEVHVVTKEVINSDSDIADVDPRYTNGHAVEDAGEELDVEETIIVEEKGPSILSTLTTGLPSPSSLLWSGLTLAINLVLLAMVWDLTYRAKVFHPSDDLSMARVGYVSHTEARVLVREPDANRYPLFVSYRYADSPLLSTSGSAYPDSAWKAGGQLPSVGNETDYTGTFTLTGLAPDTRYQWVASNNHKGSFRTAPRPGEISRRKDAAGAFTFVHSSCLKNHFPYNPFDHVLSNAGLRSFSQALKGLQAQFMLFLGDFIYIDVPHRHGVTAEDYRREYRQVYAGPDWQAAAQDLPWIHVYDDHEVQNDWDKNTTGVFDAAYDPYQHYHVSVNPPPVHADESYFSFDQGPATFFMIDTRRYRSPNDATNGSDPTTGEPTKTMLGARQLADLLAWLKRPERPGIRWKILVSSIPFTQNWWFGAQDTWRGYLGERQIILEAMWDVGLRGGVGVIILSGDRHEFAATAFPPPPEGKQELTALGQIGVGLNPFAPKSTSSPGPSPSDDNINNNPLLTKRKTWPLSATVHEFSASPLNMFYLPIRTYTEPNPSSHPDFGYGDTPYVSDVCIKYIPDGNSKFGAVSIENPATSDQSVLTYRLFVDGEESWRYTITTPPEGFGGMRGKDAIWG